MSAQGAATTFLAVGLVGLAAEGAATVVAMAVLGAILAIVVVGGAIILGVVSYASAGLDAARMHDWGWLGDLIAAPVAASSLVWLLFHPLLRLETSMASGDNHFIRLANGAPAPLWHSALALLAGLFALVIVIAAPVLSVGGMRTGDPILRKASYLGFFVTAAYWEVVAIAFVKHLPGT